MPSTIIEPMTAVSGAEPVRAGEKKHRKRAEKLQHDAERPPRSFERWRILMDVVDEGRRIAELADHKVRYALVVMGVLNTGVFLILSRAHLVSGLPPGLKPWLIGFLGVYPGLSCIFVYHAIDCLRPRRLRHTGPPPEGDLQESRGLLHWEFIEARDLASYRRAWRTARMGRGGRPARSAGARRLRPDRADDSRSGRAPPHGARQRRGQGRSWGNEAGPGAASPEGT